METPCALSSGRGKVGGLRGEEDPGWSRSSQREHPADAMPMRLLAILGCGFSLSFSARNSTLDLKKTKTKPNLTNQEAVPKANPPLAAFPPARGSASMSPPLCASP